MISYEMVYISSTLLHAERVPLKTNFSLCMFLRGKYRLISYIPLLTVHGPCVESFEVESYNADAPMMYWLKRTLGEPGTAYGARVVTGHGTKRG